MKKRLKYAKMKKDEIKMK